MTMEMGSSRLLFFFGPIFIHLVVLTIAQTNQLLHICSENGNFATNSPYRSNLDNVLSSLSDPKIDYGFYNNSFGQNNNRVNAISLCRGDKKPETCRSCINNSSQELRKLCANQKEAIIWYDDCMLRYSNRSIFGNMEAGPYFWMYNLNNVSEVDQFPQVLNSLLDNLTTKAAMGDSFRKFASGKAVAGTSQTMYALVQCTPDLSEQECRKCLNQSIELIPQCCKGSQGGRVYRPSCYFRYEKDLFYDDTVPLPPSPSPQSELLPPPQVTPVSPTPTSPPPTSTAGPAGNASGISGTAYLASLCLVLLLQYLSFPFAV